MEPITPHRETTHYRMDACILFIYLFLRGMNKLATSPSYKNMVYNHANASLPYV